MSEGFHLERRHIITMAIKTLTLHQHTMLEDQVSNFKPSMKPVSGLLQKLYQHLLQCRLEAARCSLEGYMMDIPGYPFPMTQEMRRSLLHPQHNV